MNGYYTPANPLALSHHERCVRAGAYENSLFVVAAAKAGTGDGVHLIGGSCVVDPHGRVIARASTEADELVVADLDMHQVTRARDRWDFYGRRHRERYTALTDTQFVSNRSETGNNYREKFQTTVVGGTVALGRSSRVPGVVVQPRARRSGELLGEGLTARLSWALDVRQPVNVYTRGPSSAGL